MVRTGAVKVSRTRPVLRLRPLKGTLGRSERENMLWEGTSANLLLLEYEYRSDTGCWTAVTTNAIFASRHLDNANQPLRCMQVRRQTVWVFPGGIASIPPGVSECECVPLLLSQESPIIAPVPQSAACRS